jgi:hypothetical protein
MPLARQKCFDFRSTVDELGAIAPATIRRVGERDPSGIARVPCILGHSYFLRGGLGGEGRQGRAIHRTDLVSLAKRDYRAVGAQRTPALPSAA